MALYLCSSSPLRRLHSQPSSTFCPLSAPSASSCSFFRSLRPFSTFSLSRQPRHLLSTVPSTFKSNANASFRAEPVSDLEMDAILHTMKWDSQGLVVAIAQHIDTGSILMQGFANRDAISATLTSGRATFYSRSRSTLWTKGETSHNFIKVVDVFVDCDRDSVIYLGEPNGPTCHTGSETCFFTPISNICEIAQAKNLAYAKAALFSLENTILSRKDELSGFVNGSSSNSKPSWTKKLMMDQKLLCSKIREEADELCRTLEDGEDRSRTASEMADVLYHSMVLLAVQDVKLEDVLQVLRVRFSQSGIEEKRSRQK